MKFRILILKDPHAESRGFSLKGIKVPLRDWTSVSYNDDIASFNGKKLPKGQYTEFWRVYCEDLIKAKPSLYKPLRKIETLLIPREFCDIAPIDYWSQAWN
jgi:hypothetical protein